MCSVAAGASRGPTTSAGRLGSRTTLAALLTEEDREVVDGAVAAADGDSGLDFLVVYGSVARGERRAESDLDIYLEASDLSRELNRTDPNRRWHVFGLPSPALLDNLRGKKLRPFYQRMPAPRRLEKHWPPDRRANDEQRP